MNLSKTAQLLITSSIFLVVLLIFSSVDLAITIALAAYLFFSKVNFFIIFSISLILFFIGIAINYIGIDIRYLSDLTVDAYILFALSVGLYVKSREDSLAVMKRFWKEGTDRLSQNLILSFAGSVMFSVLIFPIVGIYPASIFGYFLFSFLLKKFNGKIAVVISLFFLFLAAFFLLIKNNVIAETLANYIYLFLIIGTVQEVINLVRQKKTDDTRTPKKLFEQLHEENNFTLPDFRLPKISLPIAAVTISLLIFSLLLYSFYSIVFKYKFSFSLPNLNDIKKVATPTLTPTPTILPSPLPSISPTPIIQVSVSLMQLRILVLNGTEITGLASSTSAKLKKVGFQHVTAGDAKASDYKTWEVYLRKHDEDLAGILKNILELETLTVKEETNGAKFDIEIIAGRTK